MIYIIKLLNNLTLISNVIEESDVDEDNINYLILSNPLILNINKDFSIDLTDYLPYQSRMIDEINKVCFVNINHVTYFETVNHEKIIKLYEKSLLIRNETEQGFEFVLDNSLNKTDELINHIRLEKQSDSKELQRQFLENSKNEKIVDLSDMLNKIKKDKLN